MPGRRVLRVGAPVAPWLLLAALLLLPRVGAAQQEFPFDPAIDVQLFEYATGPHTFLTVPDAEVTPAGQFSIDFLLTFLTDPFTIYNVDEERDEIVDQRTEVVGQLLAGQIGGAYGIGDRFQLGAALPMVFSMSGDGIDVAMAGAGGGLQATGLGDLKVELKWRALRRDRAIVAVIPGVTVPTSFGTSPGDDEQLEGGAFLGDDLPTARLRVAGQWWTESRGLTLGAYVGALFRKPREIYSSEVGQQLTYGAGANLAVTDNVAVIAELFGRSGLDSNVDTSPMEAAAGLRVVASRSLSVLVGGGAGVLRGIGAPGLRVFASVGWSPDYRDQDGDGIPNKNDRCPLLEEDRDGFQDSDGCPDDDNDGDKREDAVDKCPDEPEDLDGFEDADGCREADNDGDGYADADDRCPVDPEDRKPPFDKDGCPADKRDSDDDGIMDDLDQCPDAFEDADAFEDWDGCPEADNDGDGVEDDDDQCRLCREDADGYEDDNGCPEADNDGDGVADANDRCPDESEVVNGIDDFDGCPDKGGSMLVSLDGDRVVLDAQVDFARNDTLSARGRTVADQIAAVMLTHPEVTSWRMVAAAPRQRSDNATRAASQRRANALKSHAVARGVEERRIEAIGAVSDSPVVAMVVLERGASGEFICPAGLEAVERQPTASPRAPAAAAQPSAADSDGDEDNDGDRIADRLDKCPREAETANGFEDEDGCPDELPEQVKKFSGRVDGINFETAKATITQDSYAVLDDAAKVIIDFGLYVEVSGHTDNKGSPRRNTKLSQARANAVKAYLLSKGVVAERITAIGFGPAKPIANNRTEAGRGENRRVEFRMIPASERQ